MPGTVTFTWLIHYRGVTSPGKYGNGLLEGKGIKGEEEIGSKGDPCKAPSESSRCFLMGLILLPRKVRHEILIIVRLRKPEHLDEGTRFIPTSISLHSLFGTETGQ